ncbi:MAG: transporter permease [Paenibacillaceae bacterium]|jgi:putative aldouronate transport system permease protein|nr:transporter permease [Paenibacillaceae bacterium]
MHGVRKWQWFDLFNNTSLVVLCIIMLYPFLNVIAISFSSYEQFLLNPMMIWPQDFNLSAYREIMAHPILWRSYLNTIVITVVGVALGTLLYLMTAYPLSKRHLRGRGFIMLLVIFTMLFNGGLIPNFYLVRSLGLLDTLAALVLPSLFTSFNLILMKNFLEAIPEEIEDAAKIDGASEPYILFRVIVHLSKPVIATIGLFSAVNYWNTFFNAIVYIRSVENWPLMLFLREIIDGAKMKEIATGGNMAELGSGDVMSETLKYATLIIVMTPILCVYPFLQKYFVKGIMLGSVKG